MPHVGCLPAWLSPTVVATVFGIVLFLLALVYFNETMSILEDERERLYDEREAFRRFIHRVAAIDPAPPGGPATGPGPGNGNGHGNGHGPGPPLIEKRADERLGEVRRAYRETVMAVPHYEADYDESLVEHMAFELGEEVAAAVQDGDVLTPRLQQTLVGRAEQACHERDALLSVIDEEADRLEAVGETLAEIERERDEIADAVDACPCPDADLQEDWDRLDRLEQRCTEVLDRRQQWLHEQCRAVEQPFEEVAAEYFYQPLDVSYPILAEGTRCIERLRTTKHRLVQTLSWQI